MITLLNFLKCSKTATGSTKDKVGREKPRGREIEGEGERLMVLLWENIFLRVGTFGQ